MLIMLAVQAAATPVLPNPPPLSTALISPVPPRAERGADAPVAVRTVEVVARGGSELLWQGTLRVSDRGGESSWSQTRAEPCNGRNYFGSGDRDMFSVSLSSTSRDVPGSVNLRVRWSRRGEGSCDGARTVEMSQTMVLAAGERTVVTGDGGLRLELRRR